jgi:hypothetical protein
MQRSKRGPIWHALDFILLCHIKRIKTPRRMSTDGTPSPEATHVSNMSSETKNASEQTPNPEIKKLKQKIRNQRRKIKKLREQNFELEERLSRFIDDDVNPDVVLDVTKEDAHPPVSTNPEEPVTTNKLASAMLFTGDWLRTYFLKWKGT